MSNPAILSVSNGLKADQVTDQSQASSPPAPSSGEPDLPQFLSVIEVAAVLRVDRKTVHKLIASGDLPHVRLGRVIRIPVAVLHSLRKSA
ncbi:MAG TPA: helix-turn-helix domain-containing protein [Polyangia bacterium]|jgi:excisionase family DNA binding protein|nr:helix-turn-helix domain-containing protein [Polyangia bacterium]